jgi:hypothetical protein
MNRMRMTVLTVVVLPMLALAAPPEDEARRSAEAMERLEREARRDRLARVMGLADELELDTAQALKLDETLRKFDERRRPLMEQVRDSAQALRRAAEGDAAAAKEVDAAAQRAFDARAQLAALDRELFQTLSKDLPPQKKAKLALFLARSHGMGKHQLKRLEKLDKLRDLEPRLQRKLQRFPHLERFERDGRG